MWWFATPAFACGGFFCDNVQPVVQSAERILFRHDPEEWTTFVEVQYEGPPGDFAWVVPIPQVIDPAVDVQTAPAGLFDALEQATAPRFVEAGGAAADLYSEAAGCSCGAVGDSGYVPDMSSVEVVGEAVVGPYALQVITADDGAGLTAWLQQEGYQVPYSAFPIVDGYLADGWSFLGIKLAPNVPRGPIDTLVLRCGADDPVIPLQLTSIAAVPDMEIVAYVLAEQRYAPGGDWTEVGLDPQLVTRYPSGDTDYPYVLRDAVDAVAGHGFRTEYASADFAAAIGADAAVALGSGDYLTRMHTFLSPEQMTTDPRFVPTEDGDVSNVIELGGGLAALGPATLVLGLLVGATKRRA